MHDIVTESFQSLYDICDYQACLRESSSLGEVNTFTSPEPIRKQEQRRSDKTVPRLTSEPFFFFFFFHVSGANRNPSSILNESLKLPCVTRP